MYSPEVTIESRETTFARLIEAGLVERQIASLCGYFGRVTEFLHKYGDTNRGRVEVGELTFAGEYYSDWVAGIACETIAYFTLTLLLGGTSKWTQGGKIVENVRMIALDLPRDCALVPSLVLDYYVSQLSG